MLGAFFHLACEVEGGREDQIWVRLSDLSLRIEALEIYLGGSNGLLTGGQALGQLDEFCDPSVIAVLTYRKKKGQTYAG